MLRYVLTRFAIWIPSVLIVMLAVYALAFYGAGDPIKLIFLRAPGDVAYNPERIEAIRESAGLNKPFIVQFGLYIWNLLHGQFGNSLTSGRSVWAMVSAAAPVSFQLALCSIILTAVVAIPLGMIAAMNQNTRLDYTILGSALFLWAIPAYVAGPLLMVALIVLLPMIKVPYGWGGVFDVRIILPLIVLSFQPIALIVRQTRAAVIEVLSEDFVRTARAKGVPEIVVALRHILRPVLTPVVTQARPDHDYHRQRRDLRRTRFRSAGPRTPDRSGADQLGLSRHSGNHADRILPGHGLEPLGRRALSAA